MTPLVWLLVAGVVIGVLIFIGAHRFRRDDEMGTLSSQWLDEHRRETHQTDR